MLKQPFRRFMYALAASVVALLCIPSLAFAGFTSGFYSETGQYTLSVDGGGSHTSASYTVNVEKPAGATVHRVFTLVTEAPFGTEFADALPLTFDIGGTVFTPSLSNSHVSTNFTATTLYDDITADAAAALNAAPAGTIAVSVTENAPSPSDWDGSALLVVWNDPNAPLTTIGIDIGSVTLDTAPSITYTVGAPLQVNNAGFEAVLGLGISFSFSPNNTGQVSTMSFEGNVITTTAGHHDDGTPGNGGLITIGGLGDTLDRTDIDELYEVTDLIADGATQVTTDFPAGSGDDFLTLQWIQIRNPFGVTIVDPADNSFDMTEPPYTGDAPINQTIDLTWVDENGMTVATASVMSDGVGDWTAPAQNLPEGTYTVTASATTANGTFTDSATFTIDATSPILTFDSPADGSTTNDDTPELLGTVNEDAAVEISIKDGNGVEVELLAANVVNGAWDATAASLADGTYTFEVTATDPAGNSTTVTNTITIDTVAPAFTFDTPADGALINDATPTTEGTGEDGDAVVVSFQDAGGNEIEAVMTTVAGGAWSATATMELPDGTYTVVATATDAGGNTSTETHTITIDTTPPTITFVTPADGSTTNDSTPMLGGSAGDAVNVDVSVKDANGTEVQLLATTILAGAWETNTLNLADGTYTFEATGRDAAGNTTTVTNTVTIDTTVAPFTFDNPADGAITNNNTPTFSGTVEPGATVAIAVKDSNGVTVQMIPANNTNGMWDATALMLIDGEYTVEVTAIDAAGNTATLTNTITIDTAPPALTFDAPADGSTTNDNTPNLSGTVEDGADVVISVKDANGTEVQLLAASALAGDWDANALMLSDGTYTFEATATDAAGNQTVVTNTVTIDTVVAPFTFDAPADGSSTNDSTPTLTGVVEDGATVDISVKDANGTEVQLLATTTLNGMWEATALDLADGTYTFEATATDAAGNTSTITNTVTIDTAPPAVALATPADGVSTNDDTPTVSGTAEVGSAIVVTITDANGVVVETLNPTVDGNGDWTIDASALPEGTYAVSVSATDTAGNVGMAGPNTFTVDLTLPALAIVTPVDMGATNDDTPAISGTNEANLDVDVEITDAAGAVVFSGTVATDMNGDWTIDSTQLPEGDYVVTASTTDAAGNTSMEMAGFTVDITEPGIAITAPADMSVSGTRQVDVTGTSEAGADVVVELVDDMGAVIDTQTVTADMNGDWTISFQGIENGAYDASATASDEAGNTSTDSVGFTVDSDEPNLTVEAPAVDTITNEARPVISGTADSDATITIVVTDESGAEVATYMATPDANGDWTVTPDADLPEGDLDISVTATRPNGKSATIDRPVTIDLTPPTLTVSAPTDGQISSDDTVTASGTADPGQVVIVVITDESGAEVFSGEATANENGEWTLDTPALGNGDFTVTATATDEAGNQTDVGPITITIDTSAPTVTITSPTAGEEITDPAPTISGTGEPGATVEIYIDGEKVDEVVVGEDGTWTYEAGELGVGDHTVEARTTNDAGTEGSSGELSFTIAEEKDPVTITSPSEGDTVTGPSVTVEGTGNPGDEITITIGDNTQTVTVGEDGTWSVTVDDVPEGDTTITAQAGDDSVTVNVTVEPADEGEEPEVDLILVGGCGVASAPGTAPTSLLWIVLGMIGFGWRRRKQLVG